MRALQVKLLRDLWGSRGQGLAVAVVVACSVAVSVASTATGRALLSSRDGYYADQGLADVFAEAVRVPELVAARVAALPGVAELETRVIGEARVEHAGGTARARLVSLGPGGGRFNRLYLRSGRLPVPGEAAISEAFAVASRLAPGDRLTLTINGRRQPVRISGVGLSPEFIIAVAPGSLFPEDKSFGLLWMPRTELEAAFDMEAAFNSITLRLAPGASAGEAVDGLDRILGRYGAVGAQARAQLASHRFITDELRQLDAMATLLPAIFLSVAAFLVSVTLTRLVQAQRAQIGTLKALGYGNRALALHFVSFALVVTGVGVLAGVGLGDLFGRFMAHTYADYYRFPELRYATDLGSVLRGAGLALGAAVIGAVGAVRQAIALPPAEAMRPPAPGSYHRALVERAGLDRLLSPSGRMALRNLGRRPVRSLLGTLGLAAATSILVTGAYYNDALDLMLHVAFDEALRADATVAFARPASPEAVRELARLPGVSATEPFRGSPAILRRGSRRQAVALSGAPVKGELSRVVGADGRAVAVPEDGVLLSRRLADLLDVRPGEELQVELLDGRRRVGALRVAGTVDDMLGLNATCSMESLARLAGDAGQLNGANLAVDRAARPAVARALSERPVVAAASWRADALESFRTTYGDLMGGYAAVLVLFASAIASGVVYSAIRTNYSERERELATLRVIGFTRGEAWRVLLGEVGAQVLAGLPLGALGGLGLAALSAATFSSDLFRLPVVVEPSTWVFAAGVILAAALATALLARRWLARLDLARALAAGE